MHRMRDHETLDEVLRQHISPKWEFTNLLVSMENDGWFKVSVLDLTHSATGPSFKEAMYRLAPNCWCDEIDILSPNG